MKISRILRANRYLGKIGSQHRNPMLRINMCVYTVCVAHGMRARYLIARISINKKHRESLNRRFLKRKSFRQTSRRIIHAHLQKRGRSYFFLPRIRIHTYTHTFFFTIRAEEGDWRKKLNEKSSHEGTACANIRIVNPAPTHTPPPSLARIRFSCLVPCV